MKALPIIEPHHTGLTLDVYRDHGDSCTFGVSTRHDTVWVANDIGWEYGGTRPIFREQGHMTRAEAERQGLPLMQVGIAGNRRHLRPIARDEDKTFPWFMFGGNFAYTSDSRGPTHPVHIHDRTEKSDGTCYAFYGVGDVPFDIGGFDDRRTFMSYIKALAADLRESGNTATADDFENCLTFIRRRL